MRRIVPDMKPFDRAKAYVNNIVEMNGFDLFATYVVLLPSLCLCIEKTLSTDTQLRRNKLETTGQVIDAINALREEELMKKAQ